MAGGLTVGSFYRKGNQFFTGFGAFPSVAGDAACMVADIMRLRQHAFCLRQFAAADHRLGSQCAVTLLYHIVDHNRFGPAVIRADRKMTVALNPYLNSAVRGGIVNITVFVGYIAVNGIGNNPRAVNRAARHRRYRIGQ